jgi:hypothetical protein
MNFFYGIHVYSTQLSLGVASETLQKVSPRNIFLRKWQESKFKAKNPTNAGFFESFITPNINDLVATAFFLISKILMWLLKLIYSTVYHFTYLFSGITAVLYLFGWTNSALKGVVQSFVWCLILPFVVVAILALVGNSFDEKANMGAIVSHIDSLTWLFGITLLLSLSPMITYGLVKGEGMHSVGSKVGGMVTSTALKTAAYTATAATFFKKAHENKKRQEALREKIALMKERAARYSSYRSQNRGGQSPSSNLTGENTQNQKQAELSTPKANSNSLSNNPQKNVGIQSIQSQGRSMGPDGSKKIATTSVPSLKNHRSKSPESLSTKSPVNMKGREVVEHQNRAKGVSSKVKITPRMALNRRMRRNHELQ